MNWSEFIKSLRDYMELTQGEFARRIAIKPNQVSRWERGVNKPNKTHQRKLKELARQHVFHPQKVGQDHSNSMEETSSQFKRVMANLI